MTQAKVANKNFKFSDSKKKTEIMHQIFQLNMSHVMRKLWKPYGNNKDADQPAHPRSLISIFVVHCLEQYYPYSFYMQKFKALASLWSWADRFESYLVANLWRQVILWQGSYVKPYFLILIQKLESVYVLSVRQGWFWLEN